jgi:two-component system, OmpR family, sensor kinase
LSTQNRLLLIYTTIFTVAFLVFAVIVYALPRDRILAEVDRSLQALVDQALQPGNAMIDAGGNLRLSVPDDLANFETASTFMMIVDTRGAIVARSGNLTGLDGLLDPDGRSRDRRYALVRHGDTLLRVLTVPLIAANGTQPVTVGHLQVARLLDNYENFNRVLVIALLIGMAAATASLFFAVWLTPGLFKPLEDMAMVARQITNADDLSRRVPDTGRADEIGDLARAFNQTLARLERLFQAQQRLLADVSHELRTPLTTIQGNLDLMRRMSEADPESMDVIQDEIERMTRLVGDLLLLARADAGGLPLERKPVELDDVLFEVYRQVSRLEKNVEVMVTAVDQVCVLGDADRLKQLLLILIDNAIKYTPAGGQINLSLSTSRGWAYMDVTDTGIGIPAEDIPYVFDRFYRVDKARGRAQGGSGLGLAIAKWIAHAHGGNISVKSQVGEGTTFSIALPVHKSPEEPAAEELEKTWPTLRALGSYYRR